MECEEHEGAIVSDDTEETIDGDGKEKGKTPQIQRSVAFDLSTTDEKSVELSSPIPIRRVTIR